MDELNLTILLAGVVAGAAPVLLATLGETITEKAGVVNLALDGSILLSAMTAFAVALETQSLALGYLAAAAVGALVAMLVAVFSIFLGQNQVAVGFVLTLTTRDLAYFLGNPYARVQGLSLLPQPVPLLSEIPVLGPVFFNHSLPVYGSLLLIGLCGWYFSRTPLGLELRAVGEHPRAAYARGIDPRRTAFLYAIVGGMLVGVAGATFALATKPGWGRPQGAEGAGWIALALVIFGGWNPVKAALGAYLFSLLQVLGIYFQGWFPSIPAQVFQVAPFPMMIFTLVIMYAAQKESVLLWAAGAPWASALLEIFTGRAPAALGKPFLPE